MPADLAASSAAGGRAVHPRPRSNAPQLPGVPFPCTLLPRLVRGAQGPRVPALRSPGGGGRPAGVRGGVLQLLWLPRACLWMHIWFGFVVRGGARQGPASSTESNYKRARAMKRALKEPLGVNTLQLWLPECEDERGKLVLK